MCGSVCVDNGGRNKAGWGLLDIGPLNEESTFNIAAQGVRKGIYSLVVWLKHEPKGGP